MAFIDDGQKDGRKDEDYLEIMDMLEMEKNQGFQELVYDFDDEDEEVVND